MFSFITRWFKKSDDADKEEVQEKRPEDAPPLYSMDFGDADTIVVSAVDCRKKNVEAVSRKIVRPERIRAIVELLDDLPREGEWNKEIDPCTEHTLTAHDTEGEPFARVTFYEGYLKLENGAFIANGEKDLERQKELFALVEQTMK